MKEINNVLVTTYDMSQANRDKLVCALAPAKVTFTMPNDKETIEQLIHDVDVAILNGDADEQILSGEKLRWIHCCHAGLDKTIRPEMFERGIVLTSSAGRSAPALAEHVLLFMLALTYDMPMLMRAQAKHSWAASREYFYKTGLYGKTVGMVGLGKTGAEVARLSKQFDMRVLSWRRTADKPENVDEVYSADNGQSVEEMLKQSDYVVLCAALNDATWHILNRETLALMKPTAFVINMARGALIDEIALAKALADGVIAGAGLDTFEKEPLPTDSPLWDLPNIIITPHMTPRLPDREERALEYVYQNIHAYRTGGRFVNRLTERDLYTKTGSGRA